jgi:Cysteine rich repeat
MKAQHMTKLLFAIPLVLIASAAVAQQAPQDRQKGKDACARDVSRHCRAQMQEGDQIVLACLKTNRAKISKGCQDMLASHGQ